MFYPVLVLMALLLVAVFSIMRSLSRQREIGRLKERYRQLTFASPKVAEEALRLQIVRLKNMAPGRSERWYLERVIHELERGRRCHLHGVPNPDKPEPKEF